MTKLTFCALVPTEHHRGLRNERALGQVGLRVLRLVSLVFTVKTCLCAFSEESTLSFSSLSANPFLWRPLILHMPCLVRLSLIFSCQRSGGWLVEVASQRALLFLIAPAVILSYDLALACSRTAFKPLPVT